MPVATMTSEAQVAVCLYMQHCNMCIVDLVLQAILQEIVQGLNIEKVLPSYKYSITARYIVQMY